MTARRGWLVPIAFTLAATSTASGQDPDPAAARARADAILSCVGPNAEELARLSRMLADARATLGQAGATPRARTDAAHAVAVLEGRIRGTAEAIARCVESPSAVAAPTPGRGRPETATCGPAASCQDEAAASATPVSDHVRAEPPERAEGFGRLGAAAVLGALRSIGPTIDSCYDAFAERYAIVTGETRLVFWTSPTGVVTGVALEGFTMGDAPFRACVERAVARLPSPGAPEGGPVRTRVRLRIGPE